MVIIMNNNSLTLNESVLSEIKEKNQIIERKESAIPISNCEIYITSLNCGDQNSNDQRSFSGWAYFMAEEKPDGNIFEFSKYGSMFNADPIESSLKSAIEAIKNLKNSNNIELVFENSYVPMIFSENYGKQKERLRIEAIGRENPEYWRGIRRLSLVDKLVSEINKSRNVSSLSIRYSPKENHSTLNKGEIFSDLKGFEVSSRLSEKGFNKSVKSAIWYLINNQFDKDLGKSIVTCRKNLNNSIRATKEMLLLMTEFKNETLPIEIRKKIVLLDFEPLISSLSNINNDYDKEKFLKTQEKKISLILSKKGDSGIVSKDKGLADLTV